MNENDIIDNIRDRILSEYYKKHSEIDWAAETDWAEIAARKIYKNYIE